VDEAHFPLFFFFLSGRGEEVSRIEPYACFSPLFSFSFSCRGAEKGRGKGRKVVEEPILPSFFFFPRLEKGRSETDCSFFLFPPSLGGGGSDLAGAARHAPSFFFLSRRWNMSRSS